MADEPAAAPQEAPKETPQEAAAAKDWSKVLIVVGGPVPRGEKRPVVMVERRDDKGALMQVEYPHGADLYYRTHGGIEKGVIHEKHKGEEAAAFPEGAEILTLGENVEQGGTWGLSRAQGIVHVGPASPIYGAISAAYLRLIATDPQANKMDVEVRGATKPEQVRLQPWLAALATWRPPGVPSAQSADDMAGYPLADVTVTFS